MLKQKLIKTQAKLIFLSSILVSAIAITPIAMAHNDNQTLIEVVTKRSEQDQSRDKYRNPVQTLSFFQIEPGMKVAEALPGGGWYSKILAEYLGKDGALHGINYNDDMWAMFGFFSAEQIAANSANTAKFSNLVKGFTNNGIHTSGFTFAKAPEAAKGTLDRILFVRALHNLNRFEEEAGTRSQALKLAHDLLKPNGLVGVVQHRAPEDADDKWADGSRGYLKQSALIKAFQSAGFELVMTSELNANPKDKPQANDIVWRLPPSFNGAGDDTEKRAAMRAIGESDRMTLLFKKKGADFAY